MSNLYQQIYKEGKTSGAFQRDCVPRYKIIKEFCDQYDRPFSVLDIGCHYGYFGFRLAHEFDCVSVLVDRKPIEKLCSVNKGRFIWLDHHFTADELTRLSKCEHFDVVLCYNVLHHIPDWKTAADAVMCLGDHILAEIPSRQDPGTANENVTGEMADYFEAKNGDIINMMDSHVSGNPRPTYHIAGTPGITRQSLDAEDRNAPPVKVEINSDFKSKTIKIWHKKEKLEARDFIHGMNLWNAKLLNGKWPKHFSAKLEAAVKADKDWHDDLRPWNFILDGKAVYPIDKNTKKWRTSPEENALSISKKMLND